MQKMINRRAGIYGIVAVITALMLGVLCYNFGVYLPIVLPSAAATTQFKTFSSYEELKNFLLTNSRIQGPFQIYGPWDTSSKGALVPNTVGGSDTKTYSETNVQVAGVDEADTVKTDGEYIYVLSNDTASILRAYPPEEAQVLSTLTFNDMNPVGLFVSGDRLTVLGSKYSYPLALPYYLFAPTLPPTVDVKTFVNTYDISDRTHPVQLRDYKVSGSYFGSRMIGNYVYFIASQPAYVYSGAPILPTISSASGQKEVSPTDIYYTNVTDDYFQYTTFVALNMQNTTELPTYTTLMFGSASNMYVSLNNIYVTFHSWQGDTSIYRMQVADNNIAWVANGTVLGHELDQYSMDEYNGYFRIVTNAWVNGSQQNNLYVLDMNLSIIGKLEKLATGENLHSTRFMGNRGYIVTFQKTDPLFVIDLSEPTHPYVLGQLHIPGYSDYLHPYNENYLIGVGKQTVEAEQEYFAWYQGIKVSLFDITNVTDPKQISNYVIGDRGSDSPVLSDPKAFLFDKSRNLLVIPVTVAKIDEREYPKSEYPNGVPPYVYGVKVWQGAYVFKLSPEEGFVFRGNITHLESDTSVQNSSYWIKRSLYIENVLYTVSDKKIKMNSLTDLTLLKEIELP